MSYSEQSIDLTTKLSKEIKKNNGIYFTPPSTIQKNLDILKPYFEDIKTVLEPSCGSGNIYKLCINRIQIWRSMV